MIQWLVGALLKPFTAIGEKYLDNEKDKEKLKHGTDRIAINADAAVRKVKLSSLLGQLPLFLAEFSVSIYITAILIDSTWPSDFFNPLELPDWFKEHFAVIVASIFGLPVVKTAIASWGKKKD